jgi:hypothetical protein
MVPRLERPVQPRRLPGPATPAAPPPRRAPGHDPAGLLAEARKLLRLGWCILPCAGKRPAVAYKHIRSPADRPSAAELAARFARPGVTGFGVLTGAASGGLVNRDFDVADAYRLWARAHPDLAALLPTAQTRRGYHVYARAAYVGTHALGDGEVRAGTYVVLPPSAHPSGGIYRWLIPPTDPVPAVDVRAAGLDRPWLAQSVSETRAPAPPVSDRARSRDTESSTVLLSVSPAAPGLTPAVRGAVRASLPAGPGQRNRKIFELARRLWSLPGLAGAAPAALGPAVRLWHALALPVILTKPFEASWSDFVTAWESVRVAADNNPLGPALARARSAAPPACARGYDPPAVRLLVSLCRELQRTRGDEPFYLSCRDAARLLGLADDYKTASRWLRRLVADGVLELVEPGGPQTMRASRYLFRGV